MNRQIIYCILLLLLLADLGYSFAQHLSQPLDGDMAWNIVPGDDVKPILESPLGTGVILANKSYPNPNRFFCHYFMREYFVTIPLFLQKFTDPIDSIYLSCAIIKIFIQLILIILLAASITGTFDIRRLDFMLAAVLVTPFFQTEGYQSYMGIIDRSPTYTFFYALPCALLLLYMSPFIQQYFHGKKPAAQILIYILWIPFAIVISLSGPLNPGIVLISSLLLFAGRLSKNYIQSDQSGIYQRMLTSLSGVPRNYWFYLLPVSLFSLYSLYIGMNNSNNVAIPLSELYARLPGGIYNPVTTKLGFPVLLLCLALNYLLIRKICKAVEGNKILTMFKWIGIFALLYILLLPLGGYRENRPNIIRYDTIMPVTIGLIFMFGISTIFLFKNLAGKQKRWYLPVIFAVLLLFTLNDEPQFDKNKCERIALREISESKSSIVRIQGDCNVLSWERILKPEDSRLKAQLLTIWNVTRENKLFYNE